MNGIASLYGDIDMTKVMYGQNAFHIPLNIISQRVDDKNPDLVSGVFQTSMGRQLYANSNRSHVLILGDVIVRPRMIIASDDFRGRGFASLATCGFVDQELWMKGDRILIPEL